MKTQEEKSVELPDNEQPITEKKLPPTEMLAL